ncbi:MAG: (2Fe-2S) ferredoxin domain-containing protein [Planctomycetota bacterium]|nr:(2Fe-2S) ferredoxin domain-containing protein [Planctomycetota bacterium]
METCEALRERVFEAGLRDEIRIVKSGCLAQCGHGPMVAIEPEGKWYRTVTAADTAELLAGPLADGPPLTRLEYQPENRGKNVIPPDQWPIRPSRADS